VFPNQGPVAVVHVGQLLGDFASVSFSRPFEGQQKGVYSHQNNLRRDFAVDHDVGQRLGYDIKFVVEVGGWLPKQQTSGPRVLVSEEHLNAVHNTSQLGRHM
jgi:hypothetical protein